MQDGCILVTLTVSESGSGHRGRVFSEVCRDLFSAKFAGSFGGVEEAEVEFGGLFETGFSAVHIGCSDYAVWRFKGRC